jgi:dimethylhistidine N-methyltransferase
LPVPWRSRFRQDVLEGLGRRPRTLPCKYFYDKTGSLLFDRICELPEYYLTRAETALLECHVDAIAAACGPHAVLIELGSGSSIKTRLLLDRVRDLARYVPVDISAQHLHDTALALRRRYPDLAVIPVVADYARELPSHPGFAAPHGGGRRVLFFPGSSIGNFEPSDAVALLARMRRLVGPSGVLLVGADLGRDPEAVHAAYNDRAGVTAAFNLNLLERINRELDATFRLDCFAHRAVFQVPQRRVQMRLVSLIDQRVRVGEHAFDFAAGEPIVTEHCYKHEAEGFGAIARAAGLGVTALYMDPGERMALYELRPVTAAYPSA